MHRIDIVDMVYCIELLNRFGHQGILPQRVSPDCVTYELYAPYKITVYPGETINIPILIQFRNMFRPYYAEIKQRTGLAHCSHISVNECIEHPGQSRPLAVSVSNYGKHPYTFNRGKPVANLKLSEPWDDIVMFCDEENKLSEE